MMQTHLRKTIAPGHPPTRNGTKVILNAGVLRLSGNLQRADYNFFQEACGHLCRSDVPCATLDLTHCTYVSSLIIGVLVDTVTQLKTDGKAVTVRVSPEVGRFLHMAHLYHLFSYSIVEPDSR